MAHVTGPSPRTPPGRHAAHFHRTDAELIPAVSAFLAEGILAGEPALVIAAPEHGAAIMDALTERSIDVASARRFGDLVLLDADDTLGAFTHNGMPDAQLFHRSMGQFIQETLRGRAPTPVRAYGEMVDQFWRREQRAATVRLEELWNELALTHPLSLLCGYSVANPQNDHAFDDICRLHTEVIGADRISSSRSLDARA